MPVHENWNIVHIAMQVPQSHQIYVCPENCMRGVVMTAYEMGAEDRFSCVTVNERDLIIDNLETITIDGVMNVLEELHAAGSYPSAVFVFTVCSHRFLSCDFDYVFKTLRTKIPEVTFIHGYMDCIAQKEGPMPDEKLRLEMYDFIPKSYTDEKIVNIIGSEVTATYENNDLVRMLTDSGVKVRQLSDIHNFDEYMQLGNAALNICQYKAGDMGVRHFSERLGIPYVLALPFFERDEIDTKEAEAFRDQIGDMPVVLDYMAVNCPYSLAEFLLDIGFNVRAVVADGPADYETDIYDSLIRKYSDVFSVSPTDPRLREAEYRKGLIDRLGDHKKILAIGPRAAWVFNTPYFVNQIENDGAYGVSGWNALLDKMREAVEHPKDMSILSQKGLGLMSCCI